MDEQGITDLRNYVLTQEPIFKNADSEYYHFINVYVFVNSSLIRKDALKKGQEQWSNIKRKNSDKTLVYKILLLNSYSILQFWQTKFQHFYLMNFCIGMTFIPIYTLAKEPAGPVGRRECWPLRVSALGHHALRCDEE